MGRVRKEKPLKYTSFFFDKECERLLGIIWRNTQVVKNMLIGNHAISAVSRLYADSPTAGVRRANAADNVQRPDALELSDPVQSFGDLLQKLQGMDDVRRERVEALSARTDEGTYAPAPSDIAAKMLAMRY